MTSPRPSSRVSRTALLTGASGGIGEAVARELASRGYRLVLLGRRVEALESLRASLDDQVVSVLSVDLAEPAAMDLHVGPALAELGPVDVLINNAGAGIFAPFLEQSRDEHDYLMRLNYFVASDLIRMVLPGMLERQRGHVINMASMSSKMGPWGHAGYASAKAALVSLTQTLAMEYKQADVHFTYVNPGIIDTAYFHMPGLEGLWDLVKHRAIPPQRVASAVARVLDRPQLEVCVPGHFRMLDAIRAVSPTWAHRIVARGSAPRETPVNACIAAADAVASPSPPTNPSADGNLDGHTTGA